MPENNKHHLAGQSHRYVTKYLPYAAFLLFSLFISVYLIPYCDFWVHLAQGFSIIDSRSVPNVDLFSFTHYGKEWTNWEWLHNLLSAIIWRFSGPAGIIILRSAISFVMCMVLFKLFENLSKSRLFSFALVFMVMLLVQYRISDRPQFFAYLAIAIVIYLTTTLSTIRSWRAFTLFLVMVTFRNSHPSWVAGIAIVVTLSFDRMFHKEIPFKKSDVHIFLIGAVSIFLLTPIPIDFSHYFMLQSSSQTLHTLAEWRSLMSMGHRLYSPYYILFFIFNIIMVPVLWFSYKKRPGYSFLALLFMINAYLHMRFISDAAIIGSVLFATAISEKTDEFFTKSRRTLAFLFIFCSALLLGQNTLKNQLHLHRGIGIDTDKVPLYAGEYIRENKLTGNFFGLCMGSTDFLMAYNYPQIKVAADIRVPGLYSYDFVEKYGNITNENDFRKRVLSLPVEYIILGRPDFLSHQKHEIYVEQILRKEKWVLYYFDSQYAIYGNPKIKNNDNKGSFLLLSLWNANPSEIADAITAGRFEELYAELKLLKENTAGRDNFYRDVLLSIYAIPVLNEQQKSALEELFNE